MTPTPRVPALLSLLCVLGLAAAPARAAIPKGDLTIEVQTVASGLAAPLGLTHAGDGSGRLFFVDQAGYIRIIDAGGTVLSRPFLDVSASLPALGSGFDERGLLGLAFHPDYATNGRFYVRYSEPRTGDPGDPCGGNCHRSVLSEFTASAVDPDSADASSERVLLAVDQPQANHNAGDIAFGPDGYLYVPLGDGGGANDGLNSDPPLHGPLGNGQDTTTLLGSILRIDVDAQDPGLEYAVPGTNPFVGVAGADEIYAFGFRNPYRISFDDGPGGTGALYVGDVGQNRIEEVDVVQLGGNYGWAIREGFDCFDPFNPSVPPATCPTTGAGGEPLIDPLVAYDHSDGISVIGGRVYRGDSLALRGTYVFGEFQGRLLYVEEDPPGTFGIREFRLGAADDPYGFLIKGFGEDEEGNLYICASSTASPFGTGGIIHRIVGPSNVGAEPPVTPAPALSAAPNPFRSSATVWFRLEEAGPARVGVYDVGGRRVALLTDGPRSAGEHRLTWDGGGAPAGVYFVRLEAAGTVTAVKVVREP